MPRMSSLSDLTFHTPSQIVGTPFSINAPKFEYPFPETTSSTPEPSPLSSSLPTLPSIATASFSFSAASQPLLATPPPVLHHFPNSFPLPPDMPNYSATHPMMRNVAVRDPPVPPGLAKKRHRWSLGLGLQKRSASNESWGSDASYDGSTGTAMTTESLLSRRLRERGGDVGSGIVMEADKSVRAITGDVTSDSEASPKNPPAEDHPVKSQDGVDSPGEPSE